MKALVYNGPRDVSVKEVPDPKIAEPTDALVKITTTNICGSDLHRRPATFERIPASWAQESLA